MTLSEFKREHRRIKRQEFSGQGLNLFDLAIARAHFKMDQIRQLIALAGQVEHKDARSLQKALELRLANMEKKHESFQKLKDQAFQAEEEFRNRTALQTEEQDVTTARK